MCTNRERSTGVRREERALKARPRDARLGQRACGANSPGATETAQQPPLPSRGMPGAGDVDPRPSREIAVRHWQSDTSEAVATEAATWRRRRGGKQMAGVEPCAQTVSRAFAPQAHGALPAAYGRLFSRHKKGGTPYDVPPLKSYG